MDLFKRVQFPKEIFRNSFTKSVFCFIMRLMNACRIKIVTETDGERSVSLAEGSTEISDDILTVSYLQDGDESTLQICSDSLFMSRRGAESSMSAEFRINSSSNLRLVFGENEANIPVRTVAFQKLQKRESIFIALDYELRFPENFQFFSLKIFIQSISEVK